MRVWVLLLVVTGAPVWAWPADWFHDVPVEKEKFIKLARVDWVEVEAPDVLEVEWYGKVNELMLVGKKPGRSLVLLGSEGKVALWQVRVGEPPKLDPAAEAAAKKACPTLKARAEGGAQVSVESGACRQALLSLFKTDAYEGRALEVTFAGEQLQGQLVSLQEEVKRLELPATLRYEGAGLAVEGRLTQAQHRALLWAVAKRVVGRLVVDDRVEIVEESRPHEAR